MSLCSKSVLHRLSKVKQVTTKVQLLNVLKFKMHSERATSVLFLSKLFKHILSWEIIRQIEEHSTK